ncbi:unnamed protein product [Didymodactylos carnosus]|uniref:Uncharacterized protein n=1 Tax=Didymodactylos carnosus TaxID=1234261 RepID=A0A814F9R2_9BILA|nr:unnamed protein product [Didymodactylos carnosus]CAF3751183.1 unnamed protein product [Didymodactylos carnosus]
MTTLVILDKGSVDHAINWSKVKTKLTLIDELKRAVKKIRAEVVVQSVEDFSKRMYRVLQNDGDYLR